MNKPFNVQFIRSFISAYNNFKRSFLQWFAANTSLIHLPFNMILGKITQIIKGKQSAIKETDSGRLYNVFTIELTENKMYISRTHNHLT